MRLELLIELYIHAISVDGPGGWDEEINGLFERYVKELRYICTTHTLSNTPGIKMSEAEVVAGTILAQCSRRRFKKDRIDRMGLHVQTLVQDIKRGFQVEHGDPALQLKRAWKGWQFSRKWENTFGVNSFGLVALEVLFKCLDDMKEL